MFQPYFGATFRTEMPFHNSPAQQVFSCCVRRDLCYLGWAPGCSWLAFWDHVVHKILVRIYKYAGSEAESGFMLTEWSSARKCPRFLNLYSYKFFVYLFILERVCLNSRELNEPMMRNHWNNLLIKSKSGNTAHLAWFLAFLAATFAPFGSICDPSCHAGCNIHVYGRKLISISSVILLSSHPLKYVLTKFSFYW
jgi:hypothetical protein